MDRRIWIAIGITGLLGAVVFFTWFAPKGTTEASDDLPTDAMLIASGTWQGKAGHAASGTVGLYETADGPVLFFEDFEQTPGPDVFLYASTSPTGSFDEGERWKILVPGGNDGQTTVRGDFLVPLPDAVPVDQLRSLITWCDRFGVPFADAVLERSG